LHTHIHTLLAALLLAFLVGLSGCGMNAGSQAAGPGPGGSPDSVRINFATPVLDPAHSKRVVTLNVATQVQQLYRTIFALPPMPQNMACPADGGFPSTLTFQQGTKTLATVVAADYGCKPVSIAGEPIERQSTADFWSQLDHAIATATPVARPTRLSFQHTLQAGQSPFTAQITSPEQVQRLYDVLVALPQDARNVHCSTEVWPQYRLVFHTADQAIPSPLSHMCHTVSLDGMDTARGGMDVMNDHFTQVFAQTLAGAKFAPARPDQLALTIQRGASTVQHGLVADAALTQRLYEKIFTRHRGKPDQGCPSGADKVAGKGKWYTLSFTQWDLPVLGIEAYEGSCKLVCFTVDGQVVLGDQEFWDLVHRLENSPAHAQKVRE